MSDTALEQLAVKAGFAVRWKDYLEREHRVSPNILRRLLTACGLPVSSASDIADSRRRLEAETSGATVPSLLVARQGEPLRLPAALTGDAAELEYEDGGRCDLRLSPDPSGTLTLPAVDRMGYHRLHIAGTSLTLAVTPERGFEIAGPSTGRRAWGLNAQVYSLRRAGDGGFGDFTALAAFARTSAAAGADALGVSPLHAQFAADGSRYSPYSPSSRLWLNALFADPAPVFGDEFIRKIDATLGIEAERQRLEASHLIDWPAAAQLKLRRLRAVYDAVSASMREGADACAQDFSAFKRAGGHRLAEHCRFEALHAAQLAAEPQRWHWRDWPQALQTPGSAAVERFAVERVAEIDFHGFLQWLADRGLGSVQSQARGAGMSIGVIADLAIGTDSGGSDSWSNQRSLLARVSIGAPPDLLNRQGQNWGLTAISPLALKSDGYALFLQTLRANLRHAGGLRIDHVLGLRRLWLIPEGAAAGEGAYLQYPFDELLALVALESHRHHAIVVGEDLGTVPAGFRKRLAGRGALGMSVLWFEREQERYLAPSCWSAQSAAMTTTHDLPTVAGWWKGRDLELRAALGQCDEDEHEQARNQRRQDRCELWKAFRSAEIVTGPQPAPVKPDAVIDAAISFVARTPAPLVLLPVEDLLGIGEQPNLPCTIDEHPNWRQRMDHPVQTMLDPVSAQRRLATLRRERGAK